MAAYELTIPSSSLRTPVVVEVPHAGLAIPESVRSQLSVSDEAIQRDADMYVDKLYADAPTVGAALLSATVSRYVVDLNRGPSDVDPLTVPDHPAAPGGQPRGVIWRVTTDGKPALRRPLSYAELEGRLSDFHAPYHQALQRCLDETRREFGYALLIAGHSMPSTGRRGHADPGFRRADVVPGTLGRTSAHGDLIDLIDAHFRAAGLSVRHDDPYRGGWTTAHYGRPSAGVHAVQIELNRALYMDERNGRPKSGDFEQLQALLRDLVHKVGRLRLG